MYSTRITDRVYLLETVALGQTKTVSVYVIKGARPTLIDCGYASSRETVLNGLAEVGVRPSEVKYVIPTHVHLDHAGATGHLLREMQNAQVLAHEKAVPHLIDPSKLIRSATEVFGEAMVEAFGLPIPVGGERITAAGEEMSIDLGDGLSATIIHTPGHAPHQVSVFVEKERLLLTADAVGIVYPTLSTLIPTTPPPSFEPDKFTVTLGRLRQMDSKALLVPHFGIRNDVSEVLETTGSETMKWLERVRSMRRKREGFDEMVGEMQDYVAREDGMNQGELPPYAKLSVRTTVMGLVHYLDRQA